jgi:hypothetical protein
MIRLSAPELLRTNASQIAPVLREQQQAVSRETCREPGRPSGREYRVAAAGGDGLEPSTCLFQWRFDLFNAGRQLASPTQGNGVRRALLQ